MKGYSPPLMSPTVVLSLAVHKFINVHLFINTRKNSAGFDKKHTESILFSLFQYALIKEF